MPASTVVKNFRDGAIGLADGAALTFSVAFEDGDFKGDGFKQGQLDIAVYEDRGVLSTLRKAHPKYPTFSFSCVLTDVSDAAYDTLIDAVLKQNLWVAATSTTAATGDAYTLDVTLTVAYGAETHTIVMEDCLLEAGVSEGDPDKITISGTVLGTITTT